MTIGQKEELYDKFLEAKARGNYNLAVERINELLKLHPKTAEYHFQKGRLLEENLNNLEEALESYKQAAKYRSGRAEYHCEVASCYLSLGKRQDCIAAIDRAIKADGKYIPALIAKSIALRQQQDYQEALDLANQCHELEPSFICVMLEQCENLMWLARYQELLAKSQTILSINDQTEKAYFYQGVALAWLGEYQKSQESLDRCLLVATEKQASGNDGGNRSLIVRARMFKAANLRLLGAIAEAEQSLLEMVEENPKEVGALEQLVILHIGEGELEQAAQFLQKLEEADQRYQDINWLKASLNYAAENFSEAIKYYNVILRQKFILTSRHEEALEKKALCHEYLEEYAKSIECWNEYQKLVAGSSRSQLAKLDLASEAECTIAYCLFLSGHYEKADKIVKEVLSVTADHLFALAMKAKLLNHQGKHEEAIKVAGSILKLEPEYSSAYHAKAVGLFALGRLEEAVRNFFKSFEDQAINPAKLKRYKEAMGCLVAIENQTEGSLKEQAKAAEIMIRRRRDNYLTQKKTVETRKAA